MTPVSGGEDFRPVGNSLKLWGNPVWPPTSPCPPDRETASLFHLEAWRGDFLIADGLIVSHPKILQA